MTRCQTVQVTVVDETGHAIADLTVPAYTVPAKDLRDRLDTLVEDYLDRSSIEGESMSLGDFALYVLSKAAADPRSM